MGEMRGGVDSLLFTFIFYSTLENVIPAEWDLLSKGKLECLFNTRKVFGGKENLMCKTDQFFTVLPGNATWETYLNSNDAATGPNSYYKYEGYVKYMDFYYGVYNVHGNTPGGDQSALATPLIKTGGKPACLSFVYYMYGEDLGSLYVVEKYNKVELNKKVLINEERIIASSNKFEKLIAKGDKGQKWIAKKYQIAVNGETEVQLFFTGIKGKGERSDIAVDSIKVERNVSGCPIDGKWTSWSVYTSCSVTCGIGSQQRNRACAAPTPSAGGDSCMKDISSGALAVEHTEQKICNTSVLCPVHGKWSTWTAFDSCSVPCGGGIHYRRRRCDNPTPLNNGLQCAENGSRRGMKEIQSEECNTEPCPDINECEEESDDCHGNATCNDTVGSYTCTCKRGFDGNGKNCTDRNECVTHDHRCHVNAVCINLIGSHQCICQDGFHGNGMHCADINECIDGKHGCHSNATCTNTIGSYNCTCNHSFWGNGVVCSRGGEGTQISSLKEWMTPAIILAALLVLLVVVVIIAVRLYRERRQAEEAVVKDSLVMT